MLCIVSELKIYGIDTDVRMRTVHTYSRMHAGYRRCMLPLPTHIERWPIAYRLTACTGELCKGVLTAHCRMRPKGYSKLSLNCVEEPKDLEIL